MGKHFNKLARLTIGLVLSLVVVSNFTCISYANEERLSEYNILMNSPDYLSTYHRETAKIKTKLSELDLKNIQPYYKDVPANYKYYDAIQAFTALGFVNGTGGGYFKPDDVISCRYFYQIVFNMLDPDGFESRLLRYTDSLDSAYFSEGRYLSMPEVETSIMINGMDAAMFTKDACEVAFKAACTRIYNNCLYGDDWENPTNTAFRLAYEFGIVDSAENGLLTRGQAVDILYKTFLSQEHQDVPDILNELSIDYESDIYDLSSYLVYLQRVPSQILNEFDNQGYTIEIGYRYLNNYDDGDENSNLDGMFYSIPKKIWVTSNSAIVHEFGHFVHWVNGYDSKIYELYNTELEGMKLLTGGYCATNANEYFAEAFELYLNSKDYESKVDRFIDKAPMTWEYLHNLELNNWGID